ncbi:MAG: hypothetical protein IPM36_17095 [Lewinellaceae bacterium]|nr:hypothetical protein [Lewinellaceae bacterium]
MVLQKNNVLAPFLGDRLSFIRGLDPLGLQNTSEATFSTLLPGLNNVTGRIRYYSFYCWLLDAYAQISGSTDPEEQKRFIRRAELIVALLACYAEDTINAIPGVLHAGHMVHDHPEGPFDLEQNIYNATGGTIGTYWKYPTGAFGQYYLGALRDIGIVLQRSEGAGVYVRTNSKGAEQVRGEDLANAFAASVPEQARQHFLRIIKDGQLVLGDIEVLMPYFRMDLIPENSTEQKLLIQLLIQQDYPAQISEEPSTLRRQTIKHLLQFAASETDVITPAAFTIYAYQQRGMSDGQGDECLSGWYYYQLNEYWQYGCLGALNGALQHLDALAGPGWWPIDDFLGIVANEKNLSLSEHFKAGSNNMTLGDLIENMEDLAEEDLVEYIGKSSEMGQAIFGFLLAIKACWANQKHLERLKLYAAHKKIQRDGDAVSWAQRLPGYLSQPVEVFLHKFFWKDILQRHQLVAFRKMTAGQSSQKFIIEEQKIRLLGTFDPSFTGPRINRLLSFLYDLGVLDDQFHPTEIGIPILQQVKSL